MMHFFAFVHARSAERERIVVRAENVSREAICTFAKYSRSDSRENVTASERAWKSLVPGTDHCIPMKTRAAASR